MFPPVFPPPGRRSFSTNQRSHPSEFSDHPRPSSPSHLQHHKARYHQRNEIFQKPILDCRRVSEQKFQHSLPETWQNATWKNGPKILKYGKSSEPNLHFWGVPTVNFPGCNPFDPKTKIGRWCYTKGFSWKQKGYFCLWGDVDKFWLRCDCEVRHVIFENR